jgi:amidase
MWEDATQQAEAIRAGDVSSVELIEATLGRIDRLNPSLLAYVALDREGALLAARNADQMRRGVDPGDLPPFLGVPISIKDVEDVAGLPTTHSCQVLAHNVADHDGPIVSRFRRAGFIVLGKTNIPEFCSTMTDSRLNGTCRNPWDLDRTPGGSSGGAAAALSAGLCAVAHGTDGAGSVRVPASFCGLIGLKPTRGLVSFGPDEGDPYFGTSEPGILTRSVRDAASSLSVMVQGGSPTSTWSPQPARPYLDEVIQDGPRLRVAVSTTPPMGQSTEECAAAALTTAGVLAGLGHHVEEATPDWMAMMLAAAVPMNVPGAAALIQPEQYDLLEPRNQPTVKRLAVMTVVEHAGLVTQARNATRVFSAFWDQFDVLLTPTCGMVAPLTSWATWDQTPEQHLACFSTFPNFAQPFNVSGQPALSLPLGTSATTGLPIGVQIAGRHLDEATLIRLAAELEEAMPWSDRVPQIDALSV